MIRIDLGRDELSKGSSKKSLPKIGKLDLSSVQLEPTLILVTVIGLALACLPHVFVSQYSSYIRQEHAQKMKALSDETEALKSEITKYNSFQREMQSYEEQKRLISERLNIVQQLLSSRSAPVSVLDAVGQSLPQRSWLNSIEFTLSPNPKVSVTGRSYSNEEISDFVDKVAESIHLSEVSLDSVASGKSEDGIDVKLFDLHATPKVSLPAFTKTSEPPGARPPAAQSPPTPPTPAAAAQVPAAAPSAQKDSGRPPLGKNLEEN